jgi:hypothetical protein
MMEYWNVIPIFQCSSFNVASLRDASSYYPPRARWYTRTFLVPGARVRRWAHLDGLRISDRISPGDLLLSITMPGFAFFALGRREIGWLVLGVYGLAGLVFIVALGYLGGSIAFGLMISAHSTSLVFLEGLWLGGSRFRVKMLAAVCTLLAVFAGYSQVVAFVQRHWLMPLRIGEQVVIIRNGINASSIKRGDLVAYEISEDRAAAAQIGAVHLRSGFGLDPVLALPGDRIRFAREGLFVNDHREVVSAYMPRGGELVVPEHVWFIWPSLVANMHGGVSESDISAAMRQIALVPEDQIVGKAFKRWFFLTQSR